MRTLIVNSYHADWTPKVEPVEEMVGECTEYEVVSDVELAPGFDLAGFGAVVLTGSPNLISKNEYLPKYLQFLRELRLPTLGICYGHQMLAHAFGVHVFDGGKFLEGNDTVRVLVDEPLFHGLGGEIIAMESHREHVRLADLDRAGFELLANSATCDVEAIRHIERPLFGVQFHIERSGEIGRAIMANFCRFAKDYKSDGLQSPTL
jgi:GMP synthase (glutamine-hydrolysing)